MMNQIIFDKKFQILVVLSCKYSLDVFDNGHFKVNFNIKGTQSNLSQIVHDSFSKQKEPSGCCVSIFRVHVYISH